MRLLVFCLLLFINFCNCDEKKQAKNFSEERLIITSAKLDINGVLSINLRVNLTSKATLYQWNGDLYPLFDRVVLIELIEPKKNNIIIKRAIKVLPKAPHPVDTVRADVYEYPKPLLLSVKNKNGEVFMGCLKFKVIYDTNNLKVPAKHLTTLRMESNVVEVCTYNN
jgi:hypothetical protein